MLITNLKAVPPQPCCNSPMLSERWKSVIRTRSTSWQQLLFLNAASTASDTLAKSKLWEKCDEPRSERKEDDAPVLFNLPSRMGDPSSFAHGLVHADPCQCPVHQHRTEIRRFRIIFPADGNTQSITTPGGGACNSQKYHHMS